MADGMTPEAFAQARWLAVYGAYVALRAAQLMNRGLVLNEDDVKRYAGEAEAIANMVAVANGGAGAMSDDRAPTGGCCLRCGKGTPEIMRTSVSYAVPCIDGRPHQFQRSVPEEPSWRDPDTVICDRCGRLPGVASDRRTPYCHVCMHECTFTRGELER